MLRKVVIFLVLCLGTILAYHTVDRYNETGPQLLANHDYADGLLGWQVGGQPTSSVEARPGLVRIQSTDTQASVLVSQGLSPAVLGEMVVLRGAIKTVGISGGTKGWEKGRVVLVQYVDGKAVYSTPHLLAALDGTNDWADYSAVLPILPNASEVRLELQLNRCAGELLLKGLSLFRVVENPLYGHVRWLVFGAWALFLISVFVPRFLGKSSGKLQPAFILLVFIAIIIGTTVPGWLKNTAKSEIQNQAATYSSQVIEYGGALAGDLAAGLQTAEWLWIDITKIAHFLLFGLLAGLLYAAKGNGRLRETIVDIAILACGSEMLQLFADGRSALLGDVLIDLAGAACGLLVVGFLLSIGKKDGDVCGLG